MRLLLISVKSEKSRGGIAVWTHRYMSRCDAHDIACTLVNTEAVGKRAEQGAAKRSISDEFVRTLRIFKDLNKCLKENFDAAHLNTSCGNFGLFRDYLIARRIARKGIPLVTHYHCDIPYWIHNPISHKVLGKLARLSNKNLVLCENSRRYLEEQFGVESTKIPNFIEEDLVRDTPKTINQKLERVFFVGRVSEAKGAKEMYELARRFPEITFELVGDASATVAAWGKPDNVLLPGGRPHAEVIARIDKADLFLFPSHSEGFSVALVEAMARGIPAIATDVGANADMLADGCGIVVKKGDVDAMEKALLEMQEPEKRKAMSLACMEKVRSSYSTGAVLTQLKRIYQEFY